MQFCCFTNLGRALLRAICIRVIKVNFFVSFRVRKTTNKLLHTHVALILVCVLSSLDAACVIGQIICDILIMSGQYQPCCQAPVYVISNFDVNQIYQESNPKLN